MVIYIRIEKGEVMSVIKTQDLCYEYEGGVKVLDKVNIEINEGEYVAVIGHNGSGKSTFAKLLNGLLTPTCGTVEVFGMKTTDKDKIFDIRKRIGMVFQNPDNQLVASIVEDDIAFGPENIGLDREEIGKRIEYALDVVGMQEFRNKSPERLSGGQKQRIAIAGVLALKPDILVLDESTSMLDPRGRQEVLSVVRKLNKENKVTVMVITHYMEETVEADRIIVMDKGKVAFTGTPEQVFSDKEKIIGLGLELPSATVISKKLKELGVDIKVCLSDDELKGELCRLTQKI